MKFESLWTEHFFDIENNNFWMIEILVSFSVDIQDTLKKCRTGYENRSLGRNRKSILQIQIQITFINQSLYICIHTCSYIPIGFQGLSTGTIKLIPFCM